MGWGVAAEGRASALTGSLHLPFGALLSSLVGVGAWMWGMGAAERRDEPHWRSLRPAEPSGRREPLRVRAAGEVRETVAESRQLLSGTVDRALAVRRAAGSAGPRPAPSTAAPSAAAITSSNPQVQRVLAQRARDRARTPMPAAAIRPVPAALSRRPAPARPVRPVASPHEGVAPVRPATAAARRRAVA